MRTKKTPHRSHALYKRITLSIPMTLWPYFEEQSDLPQHNGNRSSFVRSLLADAFEKDRTDKRSRK